MGAQWKTKIKETTAAAKGRIFTKLAKEIMVAARAGADPEMNSKLRLAVDQAKKASMPKDTIERAIKKGAGLLDDGVTYEKLTYEGFAPHRVPVIVECLTDNVNRTVTHIRILFRTGQLGSSGSVAWDFDYLGMIEATPAAAGADAEAAAIEAGASDLEPAENGATLFFHRAGRPGRGIARPAGAGIHRAVRPAGLPAEKPGDAGRTRARGRRGVPESY